MEVGGGGGGECLEFLQPPPCCQMSNNRGIFAKCPKIRDFQLKKDKKHLKFFACGGLISDVEQPGGGDFCKKSN